MVNNAVKFTPQGEVVIAVSLLSGNEARVTIRIAVKDTGIGIPPDRLAGLFRSFSQVDTSTTRKYGGTGLGLAISKRLCEMMGGQIGVNSCLGKGSEFWFTAVLEKQSPKARQDEIRPAIVSGRRILVVDANTSARKAICDQLRIWECLCHEAVTGAAALGMLYSAASAGSPYDIAILNVQMPDMDGATLGKKIKGDATISSTELVMLTSLGIRGDAARLKEFGFASYVTKPIKQMHLFESIATICWDRREEYRGTASPLVTKHSLSEDQKSRIRILVAEDNEVNPKFILNVIAKLGYHADAVSNGREAIQMLTNKAYHIVFMDVQMPAVDGIQATMEIRNRQSGVIDHDIPIIALTAHAMRGDREKCLQAGMNDYATKPIDPADILLKIKKWSSTAFSD